eukprot:Blabericola_migrator_1__3464@NODE_2022_length_3403_cov_186_953837_g1285_i0_p2_GENE_NODE_2022_length_3403_cov_186_953837_g1285_i0NODE_2022_length_3403_cov_186_953837_g1285_i0_p2_ORF_typecomplete_len142_score25_97HXXSHH/PF07586_11/0_023DUF2730/PF10805_8/0_11PRCH/PF03967_13/0_25_NODE_2022_length_3403_cov_186_953837_g1285_i021852610
MLYCVYEEKLRAILKTKVSTPVLEVIRSGALAMADPSRRTLREHDRLERHKRRVSSLERSIQQREEGVPAEPPKKRRKHTGNPHPLSCLKKKSAHKGTVEIPKKKRTRSKSRRRDTTSPNGPQSDNPLVLSSAPSLMIANK